MHTPFSCGRPTIPGETGWRGFLGFRGARRICIRVEVGEGVVEKGWWWWGREWELGLRREVLEGRGERWEDERREERWWRRREEGGGGIFEIGRERGRGSGMYIGRGVELSL